jgi:hypothetical protein
VLSIGGRCMVSATAWWDPAYGAPGAGDASVIAAVFVDADGAYWLHDIRYLSHDPAKLEETDEASQLCRQVAAFAEQTRVPAITIETNGLGRFLPALLRRETRRRPRGLRGGRAVLAQQQGAAHPGRLRPAARSRCAACARERVADTLHRGDAGVATRPTLSR